MSLLAGSAALMQIFLSYCAMSGRTFKIFLLSLAAVSAASAWSMSSISDAVASKLPEGHPVLPQGHPKMTHPDMTLFELLSSGIAVHRGEFDYAYTALSDAARKEQNAEIASYAWEAAVASRNSSRLLEAANLWLEFDPAAEMALQTRLADAVDRNDSTAISKALAEMDTALGVHTAKKTSGSKLRIDNAKDQKAVPGAWLSRVLRVFARTQKGNLDTFSALVSPYVEKYENSPEVLIALAQFQQTAGKGQQACTTARRALSKSPSNAKLAGEAADVCWNTDTRETRKLLKDFLTRNPDDPYVRLILGRVEQRLGNKRAAMAALELAMKKPKNDPRLYFNAGQLAADCADAVLSEKYFKAYVEKLREESPEIDLSRLEVWLQLGNAALLQKAPLRAASYYAELTTGPFASQARLREALCLSDAGKPEEARKTLQDARKTLPLDAPLFWSAEAKLLLEQHRSEDAHAVMTAAVKAMPNEPEVLYDAAMIAEETGHADAARQYLEHLVGLNPDHVQANNALGYLYVEQNIHLQKARALLERAYNASPLDPFILDSMGWLCYREGKFKAAYEFTSASLKRLYDPEVALHLIEILAVSDRKFEAQNSIADFVRRNGVTPELTKLAERLKLEIAHPKIEQQKSRAAFMRSPEEAIR